MPELSALPELLAKLLSKLLASQRDVLLIALLVAAAVIDWRTYRIPNWLTVGGMLAGLLYNTISAPSWPGGLLAALAGLGAGLIVLLPLYALRVMGAGDVKLMAAVGAFLGWPEILFAMVFSLIAGGAAALAFAVHRRALRRMASNVVDIVRFMVFAAEAGFRHHPMAGRTSIGKLPYGCSIAAGTIAWLAARTLS